MDRDDRLNARLAAYQRFVPDEILRMIGIDRIEHAELGHHVERKLTVLFADIRGYSTLAEKLSPTEIIGLLNIYLDRVGSCVMDSGGMINEIEGDGIRAVFGAPPPAEDHADQALEASRAMLAAVDALNEEWEHDGTLAKWRSVGLDRLSVRVGRLGVNLQE